MKTVAQVITNRQLLTYIVHVGQINKMLILYTHSYPPYLQAVPSSSTWGHAMGWEGHTHYNPNFTHYLIF